MCHVTKYSTIREVFIALSSAAILNEERDVDDVNH